MVVLPGGLSRPGPVARDEERLPAPGWRDTGYMSRAEVIVTADVASAVDALRHGRLVAFPTETVYGLGADASDQAAVGRIYQAKGRPSGHPVIVHLASAESLPQWAARIPDYAYLLAEEYWPGPLTLVLHRAAGVGDHVTGGLPAVGLRCPSHPVAQALLRQFGAGVAAPSANRFGRVSPTSVGHVLEELRDRLVPGLDVVLDGGSCEVGLESTIVDCTGAAPRVLRPGAVTAAQVEATAARAGSVRSGDGEPAAEPPRVPGSLASHYAPRARVYLAEPGQAADLAADLVRSYDRQAGQAGQAQRAQGETVGLIAPVGMATPVGVRRLGAPVDTQAYARMLYAALRRADEEALEVVVAVLPADEGIGHAVRDRLRRAASEDRAASEPH